MYFFANLKTKKLFSNQAALFHMKGNLFKNSLNQHITFMQLNKKDRALIECVHPHLYNSGDTVFR